MRNSASCPASRAPKVRSSIGHVRRDAVRNSRLECFKRGFDPRIVDRRMRFGTIVAAALPPHRPRQSPQQSPPPQAEVSDRGPHPIGPAPARSVRPVAAASDGRPSVASNCRTSAASSSKNRTTCSGLPRNFARNSGLCVAIPVGQVFRWHCRAMSQPSATRTARTESKLVRARAAPP